jgi:hypothetical protein
VSGVKSSRTLKWFVAVLLTLTLGWKWAVSSYGWALDPNEPEEKVATRRVADFLSRNHLNVVGSREVTFGMQLIEATSGLCRVRVVLSSSRGWHRDLIRNMTQADESNFVVFGGRIYPEQPMWLTVPDFLWTKLLQKLGLNVYSTPVITVISGPACDADRLPWKEFG